MAFVPGILALAAAAALAATQSRASVPLARLQPPLAAAVDWREAPPSAGAWSLRQGPGGSSASFGQAPGAARLVLRCDAARRVVRIAMPAAGAASVLAPVATLSIRTSTQNRSLPVTAGTPSAQADFASRDPLLDAIVFSRGRWAVSLEGAGRTRGSAILVLPVSAEVGRIVEDCRN